MPKKLQSVLRELPKPSDSILLPAVALRSVTSKTGMGVYASSDRLYRGAVFGRDSLEVAEDLVETKPALVRTILFSLASLQGMDFSKTNEEEPGKIVHEYRSVVVDGKTIDDNSMHIFTELSGKWGGNEREMAYYGSVDATPHFVRVLDAYCQRYGDALLDKPFKHRFSGERMTLRKTAQDCINWLISKLDSSASGLLEFKRKNPHGIANQVWKDSEEFYVHTDGCRANHDFPIASIEVQALVYDALMAAAYFFPDQSTYFQQRATVIRDKTIRLFWDTKKASFALGLDYTAAAQPRLIKTKAANQFTLLDSAFFTEVEPEQHRSIVSSLVRQAMSSDFLTYAGIRSRALSQSHLISHWDYHGSYVSWIKETYDIAKGLRRYGFPQLARQLENRILNVCLRYRAYPEFVYVDQRGRVLANPADSHTHGEFVLVDGTNEAEHVQAWTVSAVIAIIDQRLKQKLGRQKEFVSQGWQRELEQEIFLSIPLVDRYLNPFKLGAAYPRYFYSVTRKQL